MILIIEGQLPNLNEYTRACRTNKFAGSAMKKHAEALISYYIEKQLKTQIKGSARLAFRWYEPNKKRDLDNICFAKKFILDALVKNGVIESDGWKGVVGFTDEFFVDAENPRIEVTIESAGGEMKELLTTSRRVKEALKSSDRARKSDNWLYYMICKEILAESGINIDTVSFTDGLLNRYELDLPNFETVRRARQKIQAESPTLCADEATTAIRKEREEVFREFAVKKGI